MEPNRLKLSIEDSPESYYYENGKLGVISTEGIEAISGAY